MVSLPSKQKRESHQRFSSTQVAQLVVTLTATSRMAQKVERQRQEASQETDKRCAQNSKDQGESVLYEERRVERTWRWPALY